MALLTGSEQYIGIDAVRHASTETNLAIFDILVGMLKDRANIPFDEECAAIRPELSNYTFPHELFSDEDLDLTLEPKRLEKLKRILVAPGEGSAIQYLAPHGELATIRKASIDWIFSQAVLEHVDDLRETYQLCFRCLKADGYMTHQVDYGSHETASEWNGHWKYQQWLWTLMRGRRPWFINRIPYSVHVQLQKEASFKLYSEIIEEKQSEIARTQLAKEYNFLTDRDMRTSGAMFVVRKEAK
jgi:predicted SAM-dependent methyltransferase